MPRTNPERYSDPLRGTRTKRESARLLGCGETKVDEFMDAGTLGFVEVGNRRQPTVAALEKLLGQPLARLEAPLRAAAASATEQSKTRRRRGAVAKPEAATTEP